MRESDPVVLLEIHSPFLTAGASTRQITCNKVSSPNRSLQFPNSPLLQSLSLKGQLRDDLPSKNCAVKPPFESQTISIASLPPLHAPMPSASFLQCRGMRSVTASGVDSVHVLAEKPRPLAPHLQVVEQPRRTLTETQAPARAVSCLLNSSSGWRRVVRRVRGPRLPASLQTLHSGEQTPAR